MNGSDTQNATNPMKEASETQRRLLDAAEELFAEKGLDGTSIRDITTKAERNLAAVNYFFGNKQELYEELFRWRLREMRDARLAAIKAAMDGRSKPTLENLLHAYATAFLEPFSNPERSRRFMQLFARELVEKHLPKNMFYEEMATPVMTSFEEAITTVCPNIEKRHVEKCMHSIAGQMVHIIHIKTMFEGEQGAITTSDVKETIDHIVKFSAAGIRAYTKGNQQ